MTPEDRRTTDELVGAIERHAGDLDGLSIDPGRVVTGALERRRRRRTGALGAAAAGAAAIVVATLTLTGGAPNGASPHPAGVDAVTPATTQATAAPTPGTTASSTSGGSGPATRRETVSAEVLARAKAMPAGRGLQGNGDVVWDLNADNHIVVRVGPARVELPILSVIAADVGSADLTTGRGTMVVTGLLADGQTGVWTITDGVAARRASVRNLTDLVADSRRAVWLGERADGRRELTVMRLDSGRQTVRTLPDELEFAGVATLSADQVSVSYQLGDRPTRGLGSFAEARPGSGAPGVWYSLPFSTMAWTRLGGDSWLGSLPDNGGAGAPETNLMFKDKDATTVCAHLVRGASDLGPVDCAHRIEGGLSPTNTEAVLNLFDADGVNHVQVVSLADGSRRSLAELGFPELTRPAAWEGPSTLVTRVSAYGGDWLGLRFNLSAGTPPEQRVEQFTDGVAMLN